MDLNKRLNKVGKMLAEIEKGLTFGVDMYKPVLYKKKLAEKFGTIRALFNESVQLAFNEGGRLYQKDLENAMVESLKSSLQKRKLAPLWKEGKENCPHKFTIVDTTRIFCEECGAYLDYNDLPADLRPIDLPEEDEENGKTE